ncbi:MAG TPA: DNA topoisomerase IB [Methyloceanibacter sp.]|nr:DNA topoisomerase IB [Methyloceanibacter sp.]
MAADGAGASLEAIPTVIEPREASRAAGLRYVSDEAPGIRRQRRGESFTYKDADGRTVRDRATLKRIKSLAVPPAWTDVWICPLANGHLQATGRDQRGRKQYRYHPRWRQVRDEHKFSRMVAFGRALPMIRERVEKDLARPGLGREKVLATVVRLLEMTLIRVGNEEYVRENRSFGLTTLRTQHVDVDGTTIKFEFRAKSGKMQSIKLRDRRLARIVKACIEMPGKELFQYIDEAGERRTIDSADVNEYLREISGDEFTAKDFRTWAGTVLAALALQELQSADTQSAAKRNVTQAIERVAAKLGNTPAICRKCYVHPEVIGCYLEGSLVGLLTEKVSAKLRNDLEGLDAAEAAVLAFLQKRLERNPPLAA